ncbi:MAG: hypothetical protein Tsb002_17050 [Wenzhouxiangellaceae bacterium]
MTYTVLARRWRPGRFADLVGQEHVVQALVNGLQQGRLHHAFLFTGTRGVGKTTIARILAKSLNCETGVTAEPCGECGTCQDIDQGRFVDLLEIDAASRTKVDDTREILDNVQYAPSRGRYKVYLIDEVHMLSLSSFNALLKTLEEPPPHVKFVLATTDPHKIPVTILSRCLRFNLRRLRPEEIRNYLQNMLDSEQIAWDEEGLGLIARAADGSMRDSLSLLDQALAYGAGELRGTETQRMLGMVDQRHLERLLAALAADDTAAMLAVAGELWDMGLPPERILADLARSLHRLAVIQQVPEYNDPAGLEDTAARAMVDQFAPEAVQLYYQIVLHGLRDLDLAPDARMALEMTLLRLAAFVPDEDRPDSGSGGGQQQQASTNDPRAAARAAAQGKTSTQPAPSAAASAAVQHRPAPALAQSETMPDTAPPASAAAVAESRHTFATACASAATASAEAGAAGDPQAPWEQILAQLALTPMSREFAANLHLESRGHGQWEFVLPAHLAYLQTKRQEEALSQALNQWLQQEVRLRISQREGSFDTPATAAAEQRSAAREAAHDAAASDPVMQRLQERFDGRIIPDSIHPLDA